MTVAQAGRPSIMGLVRRSSKREAGYGIRETYKTGECSFARDAGKGGKKSGRNAGLKTS